MARRARVANEANHVRQLRYLRMGVVMLPKKTRRKYKRKQ